MRQHEQERWGRQRAHLAQRWEEAWYGHRRAFRTYMHVSGGPLLPLLPYTPERPIRTPREIRSGLLSRRYHIEEALSQAYAEQGLPPHLVSGPRAVVGITLEGYRTGIQRQLENADEQLFSLGTPVGWSGWKPPPRRVEIPTTPSTPLLQRVVG